MSNQPSTSQVERVLLWSGEHFAYWRANSAGYTSDGLGAGLYSRDEAERIVAGTDAEKKVEIKTLDEFPLFAALATQSPPPADVERMKAAMRSHHVEATVQTEDCCTIYRVMRGAVAIGGDYVDGPEADEACHDLNARETIAALSPPAATPSMREAALEIENALLPFLPITTNDTPDYAELSFGQHETQAMTMRPADWQRLNNAASALRSALTASPSPVVPEGLRELSEKATPGPWKASPYRGHIGRQVWAGEPGPDARLICADGDADDADADFIVQSVNFVRTLLADQSGVMVVEGDDHAMAERIYDAMPKRGQVAYSLSQIRMFLEAQRKALAASPSRDDRHE